MASIRRIVGILSLVALAAGCGDDDGTTTEHWEPGTALASLRKPIDGLLDIRGVIHAHSYFSHDACDGMPVVDGKRNEPCFDDLRRGMCQVRHDFLMITDHPSDVAEATPLQALLYRADRGDVVLERQGVAVASRAGCEDGSDTLVLAGAESRNIMPVGIEGHVAPMSTERDAILSSTDPEDARRLRERGAVILLSHPESWSVDALAARDIDGFEMYNIHANLEDRVSFAQAARLLQRLSRNDPGLPHPDLALMPIVRELPTYLERWGSLLARGLQRVTVMATDVHQNTLPVEMRDGERIDSYRRLMLWFSNHLLVTPEADGSWDDRHLKEALRAGRLYGAFEMFGYPEGFRYTARTEAEIAEMGSAVDFNGRPTLHVRIPRVRGVSETSEPPVLRARILRAIEGGFEEVLAGESDLSLAVTEPGAYRAEIRIIPNHLRQHLGDDAEELLARDYVWIYSNAIHVR